MDSDIFGTKNLNGRRSILAIFAHPDDETINCGGVLAEAASKKIDTYLLCLTLGGLGAQTTNITQHQLEKTRKRELQRAASVLGLTKLFLPQLQDGSLYTQRTRVKRIITQIMQAHNPSIVITHDPTGRSGHPDHVTISMCVTELFFSERFRNTRFFYSLASPSKRGRNVRATHAINIVPYLTRKYRALRAHQSQRVRPLNAPYSQLTWNTIDNEWFHMLHKINYTFCIHQFQTPRGILFPGIKKIYTLPQN